MNIDLSRRQRPTCRKMSQGAESNQQDKIAATQSQGESKNQDTVVNSDSARDAHLPVAHYLPHVSINIYITLCHPQSITKCLRLV